MMIWKDGKFVSGADAPHADAGRFAPFETMAAHDAGVPLWEHHMTRLGAAAARCKVPFQPTPELRAAAAELLLQAGHSDGILRLILIPVGPTVHTVMSTRLRSPVTKVKLLPTVVERPADAPPGDLKAEPRDYYDAILHQAQDGGADDGIVIAEDGTVLETAIANLWLLQGGVWTTPPLDGRVLPGIARELLLERAAKKGVAVAERTLDLAALHSAEALATSSAVYGPRAASLLGGAAPAVAIVDSSLGALWRDIVRDAGHGA